MYSMHLASCVALTLALLASSAPTSSSTKETQEPLRQLLLDLQILLEGATKNKNSELSRMLTFKFYMPKKVTELTHLKCMEEELLPLQKVLSLAPSKSFALKDASEFISNIKVTVLKLRGSENTLVCDYDDETVTVVEFLSRWITFCQSLIATLT